ncbi:MAG: tetraacyldisaccharide 4'-kinase [Myxococcota bacterium]
MPVPPTEDADRRAPPSTASGAGGLGALPGRAASLVWSAASRLHRTLGTRSRAVRGRPACAVVSVGGLTVGGAGKTPTAAAVARGLHARGLRVVLASRGYGGSHRDPVTVVSDGRHVRAHAERSGDESLVLAAHAPGVPVLVGRDRRIVGHRAVSGFEADVLVLDDGFQHHGLARDFDLVCVDGVAGLGNGRVLPAGPLREPRSALRGADALLVLDLEAGATPSDPRERFGIAKFVGPDVPVFRGRRTPTALVPLGGGEPIAPTSLAGREVGLLAGIARPESFRRSLEALGARVVAERIFPDHHAYRERDFGPGRGGEGLSAKVHWVTTEKDGYKILPRWLPGTRTSVLRMTLEIDEAERLSASIVDRIAPRLARLGGPRP